MKLVIEVKLAVGEICWSISHSEPVVGVKLAVEKFVGVSPIWRCVFHSELVVVLCTLWLVSWNITVVSSLCHDRDFFNSCSTNLHMYLSLACISHSAHNLHSSSSSFQSPLALIQFISNTIIHGEIWIVANSLHTTNSLIFHH